MAAKRKHRRTDPHRALREHVLELLGKGHAHVTFRDAIAAWPAALRGAKPPGQPFTPWRLLEHIRISQWDIVEFTKSASHVSPEWPAGYWPLNDPPPERHRTDRAARGPGARRPQLLSPGTARAAASPARRLEGGLTLATRLESPIGELVITASASGLTGVWFPGVDLLGVEPDDERKPPSSHLARACEQLAEYFAKARTAFDLPLDPPGTPFQRRVWSALRIIPYGTTVSYGDLAR